MTGVVGGRGVVVGRRTDAVGGVKLPEGSRSGAKGAGGKSRTELATGGTDQAVGLVDFIVPADADTLHEGVKLTSTYAGETGC